MKKPRTAGRPGLSPGKSIYGHTIVSELGRLKAQMQSRPTRAGWSLSPPAPPTGRLVPAHSPRQTVTSPGSYFGGIARAGSRSLSPTREMRGPHHVGDRDPLPALSGFTNP
jgi:hypothetical protein